MKYVVTVELTHKDRPLKAKDLRGALAKFPRTAPKLFRKAIRALCWPFGANIHVEFVEDENVSPGANQPGRKKRQKRKT